MSQIDRYPKRQVALLVETSLAFGRGIIQGVAQYIRLNEPWSIYVQERALYDDLPQWMDNWEGNGIISRISSPAVSDKLHRLLEQKPGIALVNLNEELAPERPPSIQSDNIAIGKLAAEHLMERGFRHFGFVGCGDLFWSKQREIGFLETLKQHNFDCSAYSWQPNVTRQTLPNWENEIDAIEAWLKTLKRPTGIMACNDFRALELMDACQRLKIAIPEQVAVLGVDNDEVACELAYPPLTSILPDTETIGFKAAEALDRLMNQEKLPFDELKIKPRTIKVRHSTDIVAIDDSVVAESVYFIRENACKGIDIEDVLDYVGVSRSTLQRRFKAMLNQSILDVIINTRMEKVKQLLIETEMALPEIAKMTGFLHSEYLSHVFKKQTGQTTSEFRRSYPKHGRRR